MTKNKTSALITMFLVLTIATTIIAIPITYAHTPRWELITFAYLAVNPNPVGVGQTVFINMWVDKPMPEAAINNDIRRRDYTLTITKPDGTSENKTFKVADTTGVVYTSYKPTEVGTYSFLFYYAGQEYTWNATANQRVFTGDIFLSATSKAVSLTVQEDPLPDPRTSYPLPTEYWARPIEGQNTDWWKISSNYLRGAQIVDGAVQPDGTAPNSPHVMWTKPIQFGGVAGGTNTGVDGMTFYSGLSYETRFTNTIIMNGRLYYPLPRSHAGSGNGYAAVDLRTGEEIYWQNMSMPSFGELHWYDSENQHGIIPNGYLWRTSGTTYMAYDPWDGNWLFNVTNVPSGFTAYGENGEILIYVLNVQQNWLALWNFTQVFATGQVMTDYRPVGRVLNGSTAYTWNKTLSMPIQTGSTVRFTIQDDALLFSNIATTYSGRYGTNNPYAVGAISLNPTSRGTVTWMKNYSAPTTVGDTIGVSRKLTPVDPVNRVFMLRDKETMVWNAYSLDDGSPMWVADPIPTVPDWEYFSEGGFTAYGKLYYAGYGGILYAYDTKNGSLLWTYGNGGPGNSTNSGLQTPWGLRPVFIGTIADGKIYLFSSEHSPNEPMYKDTLVRVVDAYTGEEIWTLTSFVNPGSFMAAGIAIADGYMAYLNLYDSQIYVIGKGPSAITVTGPEAVQPLGTSVVIKGTVTDLAAGTKQKEQAARFPNGVPAMSDASMKEWMEYVYMQKPKPTDATGVEVTISVVDSNGNFREIGKTTSDSDGFYSLMWTPDISGKYTVIASFAGSESYWPSHAESAFGVDEAPLPPPEEPQAPPDMTDTYIMGVGVAIIIAVAVIGAIILIAIRKRP